MADDFKIKGSTVRTKLAFLRERFGPEAETALADHLAARGFPRILDASWYPFEVYESALEHIVAHHYEQPEGLVEVGTFSARNALTTTYEAFAGQRDFAGFLALLPHLHHRLYTGGHLQIDHRPADGECVIGLRAMPRYADVDLFISAGFFAGAARLLGHEDAVCRSQPAEEGVDFVITWAT